MTAQNGTAKSPPDRPIVLVGFMAAGKSRIGRILAERLKLRFVDSDRLIEQSYGMPIPRIFEDHGEAEFRKAERETISQLLSQEPQVIAVGGGAFIDELTRDALNRGACTVWLDAPFELVMERLGRSNARPLATGKSETELRALWNDRRQYYAEAQVRIDVAEPNQARIIGQIIGKLRQASQR